MSYPAPPAPFLKAVVHDLAKNPPIAALCAGYELGEWRHQALAKHTMEWLPEFCLSAEELRSFEPGTALRQIEKAARLVYQTEKYKLRGEFGEMFLHIALRQIYKSIPAISKIFWKDSASVTVKGFDAVHVVDFNGALELWLGEVKFYDDATRAIRDVMDELIKHTKADYLKQEFMLITNKLDKDDVHYERLSKLLDPNTSLDEVFDAACIPVLLTYDSDAIKGHTKDDQDYQAAIQKEVDGILAKFSEKLALNPIPIKVHLFLLPVHTKEKLIERMHASLMRLQGD